MRLLTNSDNAFIAVVYRFIGIIKKIGVFNTSVHFFKGLYSYWLCDVTDISSEQPTNDPLAGDVTIFE